MILTRHGQVTLIYIAESEEGQVELILQLEE